MRNILNIAVLVFVVVLCSDIASAQMQGGMGGRRGSHGEAPAQANAAAARPDPLGEAEGMTEELFERLKITPEQTSLWQTFAVRVNLVIDDRKRWNARNHQADPTLPAPKGIETQLEALQNRLTALEDVSAAFDALYAALSPQQQADTNIALPEIIALLAGMSEAERTGHASKGND